MYEVSKTERGSSGWIGLSSGCTGTLHPMNKRCRTPSTDVDQTSTVGRKQKLSRGHKKGITPFPLSFGQFLTFDIFCSVCFPCFFLLHILLSFQVDLFGQDACVCSFVLLNSSLTPRHVVSSGNSHCYKRDGTKDSTPGQRIVFNYCFSMTFYMYLDDKLMVCAIEETLQV
jgi:hypothetical protein